MPPERTLRRKPSSTSGESDADSLTRRSRSSNTMSFSYNLLEKPWIPVTTQNGKTEDVGLRDLLVRAHQLREIAHDSPLFQASILTIAVALLQSAWAGETQRERDREWLRLWAKGRFDDAPLDAYFAKWADRFDLFHPQFPFYQTAGLEMVESSELARLAMEENNAPAMFSNAANPDWKAPSPALAAQLLVTIQNFALGFGKSSRAKLAGTEIEPPYSADGPLLRGLTVWPSGASLFETFLLCTVPHERALDDQPCWELDEPHLLRDVSLPSGGRKTAPVRGICDWLTVQSRLIRLLPVESDGQISVPRAYFTQGRSLEKGAGVAFHPFKLYVESKQSGYAALALSEHKAIWRNSAALLSKASREKNALNPLAFVAQQSENGDLNADFRAGLDVIGMATDPGKPGKFLLWRHDRLPLPLALLLQESTEANVDAAIKEADALADEMRARFAVVARTLLMPERLGTGISPDPDDVKNLVNKFDPRRAFWPRLETPFLEFLAQMPLDYASALAQWRAQIEAAANTSFQAACHSLGDGPRAVVAVAQVYPTFSLAFLGAQKAKGAAKTKGANTGGVGAKNNSSSSVAA